MEDRRHHLCMLSLPYFNSSVLPGKDTVSFLGALTLVASAQETLLYCLALVASRTYTCGPKELCLHTLKAAVCGSASSELWS